ncbi:MAG: NAD(P)/FAD-dependent oxidoreductase [Clostridia bacterium]|nr:NAD(P)/FAD-dependent oxidoreductase [Clostridia bacterium]
MTYDIAIIGAGPAGVSAAINAKILNKSFIWLAGSLESKKVSRAEKILNYPGLPAISGEDLSAALKAHCDSLSISPTAAKVTGIYPSKTSFTLLAGDEAPVARSVILCLGVESFKPVPGELDFLGRGVSYCATCDGFLYRGKTIAVLCTDKRLEHEISFLAGIAAKVYLMPMYPGCEVQGDNIQIIQKFPVSFQGDMRLSKVCFKDGEISVDGAFLLKESLPPASLISGLATEEGHIAVSRSCATNIPGVFAAGDCTGRPYQYAKAVGEGNVAAHSAVEYLAALDKR